jgi:peptidoglycan/xylan/chitin deacetylase (PgdA/CDA1 family)
MPRTLLKRSLRRLGALPAVWAAALAARGGAGLVVLMYHRIGTHPVFQGVEPDRFRRQMRWLRRNCAVIAPEDLEAGLRGERGGRPPVLLTFDDGYRDFHDVAFPVLRELGLPAVVFLSTGLLDEGGALWSDRLRWAIHASGRPDVRFPWADGEAHSLAARPARQRALGAALRYLKHCAEGERRLALTALFRALGAPATGPELPRQMMTWDEVRATMPLVRPGGHTHTHPILARVPADTQQAEVRACRERIEAMCGVPPRLFAYPNGQQGDFTAETQAIVRQQGFEAAFSAVEGTNGQGADRMALRRFSGRSEFPQLGWLARPAAAAP